MKHLTTHNTGRNMLATSILSNKRFSSNLLIKFYSFIHLTQCFPTREPRTQWFRRLFTWFPKTVIKTLLWMFMFRDILMFQRLRHLKKILIYGNGSQPTFGSTHTLIKLCRYFSANQDGCMCLKIKILNNYWHT